MSSKTALPRNRSLAPADLPAPVQADPELAARVLSGGRPGAPNGGLPPIPPIQSDLHADLRAEYVVSGGWTWYANYARSLPWAIDDITTDFGDDLYERMLFHHQVAACLNVFKAGVLEDGLNLASAVDDKDDPDFATAAAITDWCGDVLDNLTPGIDATLWNLTDALAFGNKLAELLFVLDASYTGQTQLILTALKVKPRESTSFVVDSFKNVIGLLGLIPGLPMPVQIGQIIGDPAAIPNFLPRDKFAIFTWRPRDGDPRGTSLLRPAYDSWWRSVQVRAEELRYLTQFGSPSLIGYTSPASQAMPATDHNGNVLLDANGNPILLTPEQSMVTALEGFRNGTVMSFPNGSAVDMFHAVETQAFDRFFARTDMEITKAILNQDLAINEGMHATRAQSQVHQDVQGMIIRQAKNDVERTVRQDVLRKMVRWNYGERSVHLTPRVSLGSVEEQDVAPKVTAYAAAGYTFDPSQFPGIDEELGLPERTVSDENLGANVVPDPTLGDPNANQAPAVSPQPAAPKRRGAGRSRKVLPQTPGALAAARAKALAGARRGSPAQKKEAA